MSDIIKRLKQISEIRALLSKYEEASEASQLIFIGPLRAYKGNKNVQELRATLGEEQECIYQEVKKLVEDNLSNAITTLLITEEECS